MSVSVIRRFCRTCGQKRPFEKQGISHVLHLILTICTLGAVSVLKPHRCRECGQARYL